MNNKTVVITGAANGIGKATAQKMASKGAKVAVTDTNETEGIKTVELIKKSGGIAEFFYLDVTQPTSVEQAMNKVVETFGPINYAVNNAGIGAVLAAVHEIDMDDWNRMIAINLTGVMLSMRAQLKSLLPNGGGKIVNVASMAAMKGVARGSAYAAAKHGVIGLTKSAAVEYAEYNVSVNAVCPGFVETTLIEDLPEEFLNYMSQVRIPMKRFCQPEEVANAIIYLLSEENSYTTGHCLTLDGGLNLT